MADPVYCFSVAVNLRISGPSHNERIALALPPILYLLASVYLAQLSRTRIRFKNCLIFVEAFTYTGLCFGDFGLHEASQANTSPTFLNTYAVADRAIGALSGLPLVCYMIFLPVFLDAAVLPYLSKHWHYVPMYVIILSIPVALVLEELSSLFGGAYGLEGLFTVTQGYISGAAKNLAVTLGIVTLAILLVVQLTSSLLCVRLVGHINHIQELGGSIPGVTVRATVLFGAGTALGAMDAAFGFVSSPIFATVLLRRIIFTLSRLLIVTALVSQRNSDPRRPPSRVRLGRGIEGKVPKSNGRRSRILALIGNPRYSTFAHLQGDATAAKEALEAENRRKQRVTLTYDYPNPPKLEMRFSQLSFPMARPLALSPTRDLEAARQARHLSDSVSPESGENGLHHTRSVRANPSLYQYRPEYFFSPPRPEPAMIAGSVVRVDSPLLGHRALTPQGGHGKNKSDDTVKNTTPQPPPLESRDNSHSESSLGGIVAQFPETPRTGSARTALGTNNRISISNDLVSPVLVTAREAESNPFEDQSASDAELKIAKVLQPQETRQTYKADSRPPRQIAPSRIPKSKKMRDQRNDGPTTASSFLELGERDSPEPMSAVTKGESSFSDLSTMSELLAPPRRIDMRHQRVPTADLAPLDVFRERFAEQRRGRSSGSAHSAHSSRAGSLDTSASPPPQPPPQSHSRAVSESESKARDKARARLEGSRGTHTSSSSAGSFFVGVDTSKGKAAFDAPEPRSAWSATHSSERETQRDNITTAEITDKGFEEDDDTSSLRPPPSIGSLGRVDSRRLTPTPNDGPSSLATEHRGSIVGIAR